MDNGPKMGCPSDLMTILLLDCQYISSFSEPQRAPSRKSSFKGRTFSSASKGDVCFSTTLGMEENGGDYQYYPSTSRLRVAPEFVSCDQG
jgi:hypothetical protein